jgi:hypothetical protein
VLDEKNTITLFASKLVGVVGAKVPEEVNVWTILPAAYATVPPV